MAERADRGLSLQMTEPLSDQPPLLDASLDRLSAPPDISIIIPVFNREGSIGRAIRSTVGGGLSSELIVVDDGSTDNTVDAARQAIAEAGISRARVLCQANAGPGAARNRGAAVARGGWIAFLDSDDYWFPWTLCHVADVLAADARPAFLFLQFIDNAGDMVPEIIETASTSQHFAGFAEAFAAGQITRFGAGNLIIRRDTFDALGGFTVKADCGEDGDLFLRGNRHGDCVLLTGVPLVSLQTGREDNLTSNFQHVRTGLRYLLAQDRRGAYPEPPSGPGPKEDFLARLVVHAIRTGFGAGYPIAAYALYFRYFGRLVAGRNWHWLVRLPLTPLLHLLRPANFPFRWRPKRRG